MFTERNYCRTVNTYSMFVIFYLITCLLCILYRSSVLIKTHRRMFKNISSGETQITAQI